MKKAIIIMTKVPRAGSVKTRLQPFLSPQECCSLAESFLADTINKARKIGGELIIAFAPAAEKDYFKRFEAEQLTLAAQVGTTLGDKISHAFDEAFHNSPNAAVVMIGTDSPTFPANFIERAFLELNSEESAVLGESADGGFYLIGLRKSAPSLFENIEWSSPRVYEQISRNAADLNLTLKSVPEWFDVDEPNDLRHLLVEMTTDENARRIAPETFRWLTANRKNLGSTD